MNVCCCCYCYCCFLLNDDHVLQIWLETVAVRRQMVYVLNDIWLSYNRERKWPKFPEIYLRVEGKTPEKTSTRKLTRPGIEPGPTAWEVMMLPLHHSGGKNVNIKYKRNSVAPELRSTKDQLKRLLPDGNAGSVNFQFHFQFSWPDIATFRIN